MSTAPSNCGANQVPRKPYLVDRLWWHSTWPGDQKGLDTQHSPQLCRRASSKKFVLLIQFIGESLELVP